ncbi:hypothetical protein KKF91_22380 [Myxococcota bacterium]|nr:hypothetical protein [Myxococcota bacterium]
MNEDVVELSEYMVTKTEKITLLLKKRSSFCLKLFHITLILVSIDILNILFQYKYIDKNQLLDKISLEIQYFHFLVSLMIIISFFKMIYLYIDINSIYTRFEKILLIIFELERERIDLKHVYRKLSRIDGGNRLKIEKTFLVIEEFISIRELELKLFVSSVVIAVIIVVDVIFSFFSGYFLSFSILLLPLLYISTLTHELVVK